jgi:hypothetical protein
MPQYHDQCACCKMWWHRNKQTRTYPVPERLKDALTSQGCYSGCNNRICNRCWLRWRKGKCLHSIHNGLDVLLSFAEEKKDEEKTNEENKNEQNKHEEDNGKNRSSTSLPKFAPSVAPSDFPPTNYNVYNVTVSTAGHIRKR